MFEELAGYIKGIVFFSLFANLILDFMPNINYKKYIKVLIGILLIIVILKPILNFDFLLNEINDKVDDVSQITTSEIQEALGGVEINECANVGAVTAAVAEGSNEVVPQLL